MGVVDLTSTAPRGEGRWTGQMNPFHRSSSTGLGLRHKLTDNTGVGGWAKEKGGGARDEAHGGEARESLMIVLVIVQVSNKAINMLRWHCPQEGMPT